jgi:hypothetical protein
MALPMLISASDITASVIEWICAATVGLWVTGDAAAAAGSFAAASCPSTVDTLHCLGPGHFVGLLLCCQSP